GQVAGHEGEDAGSEEGEESREERDGDLAPAHPSNRSSSASRRRSRSGSSGSPGASSTWRRLQPHAIAPTPTAPAARMPIGTSHASRSNPDFGGSRTPPRPHRP